MVAYIVAQVKINDHEAYDAYKKVSGLSVEAYGGRFLARGGKMEILEGTSDAERVVVIEFPDAETARLWYDSPEYREARAIRANASKALFILVSA